MCIYIYIYIYTHVYTYIYIYIYVYNVDILCSQDRPHLFMILGVYSIGFSNRIEDSNTGKFDSRTLSRETLSRWTGRGSQDRPRPFYDACFLINLFIIVLCCLLYVFVCYTHIHMCIHIYIYI